MLPSSLLSLLVCRRARSAEEGSAQEPASRQPLLHQLNADLAKAEQAKAELKASLGTAQDSLAVSNQQVASLIEQLESKGAELIASEVCLACLAYHLCTLLSPVSTAIMFDAQLPQTLLPWQPSKRHAASAHTFVHACCSIAFCLCIPIANV